MRRSDTALVVISLGAVLAAATGLHAALVGEADLLQRRQVAAGLQITDFALFTEARYTRHPSQADLHSAFQDHPMALDHFPSGSFRAPPAFDTLQRWKDADATVD